MARVNVTATMPDELLREFLQLIRTWDGGRQDRHGVITIHDCQITAADMATLLRELDPPLADVWIAPVPRVQ